MEQRADSRRQRALARQLALACGAARDMRANRRVLHGRKRAVKIGV
jgi:hypothetical protein